MGGSVMMMEYALLKDDKQADRRVFALDTFFGFVRRNEELDIDIQTGLPVCYPPHQIWMISARARSKI
jgi:hypothetical protein